MSPSAVDSYHPRYSDDRPPRPPPAAEKAMYHFRGGQRKRGDFSFRPRISERDLLTHFPTTNETPVLGSNHIGDKFRDVDNLTDSEEEEMDEDVSDDEDNSRAKRRKIVQTDGNAESTVKWSNPDPYTSLPPPMETTGTRVDVVKLIRKARNESTAQNTTFADQNDFISFDTIDDDQFAPPSNAPAGPKADARSQPDTSTAGPTLGKRKRAEYERDTLIGPPNRQFHASCAVLAAWRATRHDSPTPWLEVLSGTDSPMVALHKEILDFYGWVKPHEFEAEVREDLMSRLDKVLKRFNSGCQLKSFGSYAAGLYLPTGDMDLVCFLPGVPTNTLVSKNKMFSISHFLERDGLARRGSVQVIAGAKVPIIKFVDDPTGLKVDLSFSNTTGIVANETFEKWQATYPAMPIIVAVVKQFLMIRGLNDNSVGGLGGFATICMVTSLIQNLPASGSHNLGELLVEFFNLYGNLLDIKSVGIRMDPPGFIDKFRYPPLMDEKVDRLMIIDPNRPDNNITGGSNQITRIIDLFSRTHEMLMARLDDFADPRHKGNDFSFLEELIGGNFAAYQDQRRRLHRVYNKISGVVPPPPPPPVLLSPVPPPPPTRLPAATKHTGKTSVDEEDSDGDADGAQTGSRSNKSQKRLERVKRLCPELLPKLSGLETLTKHKALKLGVWKDLRSMSKDLEQRAQQQQSKAGKGTKKA